MSVVMRASTTKTISRRRPAARGWGQCVRLGNGGTTWPTGSPTRGGRFDDPIDDQLRHAIAWSDIASADLARAAGMSPATIDRFMRGGDVLTIGQAARLAALLGLRLADQAIVAGLGRVWERAGRRALSCPRNTVAAAAWRRARTRV